MRITHSLMFGALALALSVGQANALTVTFDSGIGGGAIPYTESGMTISSMNIGGQVFTGFDNNADGSKDLYGAFNNNTTTYKFTLGGGQFTLDHLGVVGFLGAGLGNGSINSNLGGSILLSSKGTLELASLPIGQQQLWMGITEFTWIQNAGGLMLDDINFTLTPLNGSPTAPAPLANPEPSSVILMGSGLAALIARRMRKQ